MGNTCGACCGNEGSAEFYTDKKEDAGTKTMSGVNNQDHSKEKSLTMNLAKNTTAGGVGTVFDPTALEIDNERYNNPNVNVNIPPNSLNPFKHRNSESSWNPSTTGTAKWTRATRKSGRLWSWTTERNTRESGSWGPTCERAAGCRSGSMARATTATGRRTGPMATAG